MSYVIVNVVRALSLGLLNGRASTVTLWLLPEVALVGTVYLM